MMDRYNTIDIKQLEVTPQDADNTYLGIDENGQLIRTKIELSSGGGEAFANIVERTVYLTSIRDWDEYIELNDITEEQRAYNIETYEMGYGDNIPLITYQGRIFEMSSGHWSPSEGTGEVCFSRVVGDTMLLQEIGVFSIVINHKGDADASVALYDVKGFKYAEERTIYFVTEGEEYTAEQQQYNVDTFKIISEGKTVIANADGVLLWAIPEYVNDVLSNVIFISQVGANPMFGNMSAMLNLKPDGTVEVETVEGLILISNSEGIISYFNAYKKGILPQTYKIRNNMLCLIDNVIMINNVGKIAYNDTDKRYIETYNTETGELIDTLTIPIGGGVDLSNYYTKQEINNKGYVTDSDVNDYVGNEIGQLEEVINTKQDKITDLDTIRSGAAAGATALQSIPSEYVTETELETRLENIEVEVSLNNYYTKAEVDEIVGDINYVLTSI